VLGADEDMNRVAAFVRRNLGLLRDIDVTLEFHHEVHIAHPIFWRHAEGKHPPPFAILTPGDLEAGIWTTTTKLCAWSWKAAEGVLGSWRASSRR
jgi:hypothetical protein